MMASEISGPVGQFGASLTRPLTVPLGWGHKLGVQFWRSDRSVTWPSQGPRWLRRNGTSRASVFLVFLVGVAACLAVAGCGRTDPEAELARGLAEAEQIRSQGDLRGAIARLEALEAAYPEAVEVKEELAFLFSELGDFPLAALYYQGLLDSVDRNNPQWLLAAARAYQSNGQWQLAAASYARYLEQRPGDDVNRRAYATALERTGDLRAGLEERQRALGDLSSASQAALVELGQRALEAGALEAAADYFRVSLDRAPSQVAGSSQREGGAVVSSEEADATATAYLGLLEVHLRQRAWEPAYAALTALREQFPQVLARSDLVARQPTLEAALDAWRARQVAESQAASLTAATEPPVAAADAPPPLEPRPSTEEAATTLASASEPAGRGETPEEPPRFVVITPPRTAERGTILVNGRPFPETEPTVSPAPAASGSQEVVATPESPEIEDSGVTTASSDPVPSAPDESSAAPDSTQLRARKFAVEALASFEGGDFAPAARLYRQALSLDAAQASYAYGASRADTARGSLQDAEVMAREAVRLHQEASRREGVPERARYTVHLLRILEQTRPSHTVLVELFEARRRFPSDETLTLSLAEAFDQLRTGSPEAEALYEDFLRLAPDHPRAVAVRSRLVEIRRESASSIAP